MTAIEIIRAKANPEGWPMSQKELADSLIARTRAGKDLVLKFGNVVFTVGTNPAEPVVHLYSLGAGSSILVATARFHRAVWGRVKHHFLIAPIENKGVQLLASRFGWIDTGSRAITGHPIYITRRPS